MRNAGKLGRAGVSWVVAMGVVAASLAAGRAEAKAPGLESCVGRKRPLLPKGTPRPPHRCDAVTQDGQEATREAADQRGGERAPEPDDEPVSPPPLVEAETTPALPPMPPSRFERLGAESDHDRELRDASEGRSEAPRRLRPSRARLSVTTPAPAGGAEDVPTDRFGPTATANVLHTLDAGPTSEGSFGWAVRVGARFALLKRRDSPVAFTPTVSLLAALEGSFSRQGLGLEARIGAALTRPLRGFFPFLQLYALIAGGFEGAGFNPEVGWLRFGLGLQLNFLTLFTSRYTVGDFAMAFMGAIGAYFRALFGGGWGGGWGGGGGGAGIIALAVVIAVLVVPPVAIFTGMVVSFAAMLVNVELSYQPSLDPRRPAFGEVRFGVGF